MSHRNTETAWARIAMLLAAFAVLALFDLTAKAQPPLDYTQKGVATGGGMTITWELPVDTPDTDPDEDEGFFYGSSGTSQFTLVDTNEDPDLVINCDIAFAYAVDNNPSYDDEIGIGGDDCDFETLGSPYFSMQGPEDTINDVSFPLIFDVTEWVAHPTYWTRMFNAHNRYVDSYVATVDSDMDGEQDHEDNCVATSNASQEDDDSDGYGDHCDADWDGDTTIDGGEANDYGYCNAYDSAAPWTETMSHSGVSCERADLNNSGAIDGTDYLLFGAGFARGYQGPSCADFPDGCE